MSVAPPCESARCGDDIPQRESGMRHAPSRNGASVPVPSTASNALLPAGACRFRRVRYRPRVLNASPRSRQNSFWLNPLDSYSATNCSTSCRLRRRRTSHTCCSFMPLLHHEVHHSKRWFPLTLTFEMRDHDNRLVYYLFFASNND